MAKSTITIKHLGLISTGKFMSIFCFILSMLMLLVYGVIFGVIMLIIMVLGLSLGGKDSLLGMVMTGGFSLVWFVLMAVVFVVVYTIMGFIMGILTAFAYNIVAKLSGGLSFDAEMS